MAPDEVSRISQAKIRKLQKVRAIAAYVSRPVKSSRAGSRKRKRDAMPDECHDGARSDAQRIDSFTVPPSALKQPVKVKKLPSESCVPVLNVVAAVIPGDGITSGEIQAAETEECSITMGGNPSTVPSLNKDGAECPAAVPLPPRKRVALMQVGSGSNSTTVRSGKPRNWPPEKWEIDYRKEIREKILREMELVSNPDLPNKAADSTENNNSLPENGATGSDGGFFFTTDTPNFMVDHVPVLLELGVAEKVNDILRDIHAGDHESDPAMVEREECANIVVNDARHFDPGQLRPEDCATEKSHPDPPQIHLDEDINRHSVVIRDCSGATNANGLLADFCNHTQVADHVPVPLGVTAKTSDVLQRDIHAGDHEMVEREECANIVVNDARHFDPGQLRAEDSATEKSHPDPPQIHLDEDINRHSVVIRDCSGATNANGLLADFCNHTQVADHVPVPLGVTAKTSDVLQRDIHAGDHEMVEREECANIVVNDARHFDPGQLRAEDSATEKSHPDPPQIHLDEDINRHSVVIRDCSGATNANGLLADFCNHTQVDDHDQKGNDEVNTGENYHDLPAKVDDLINELDTVLTRAPGTEDILRILDLEGHDHQPSAHPQLVEQNCAARNVFLLDPQSAAQCGPSFPDRLHCTTEGCRKFSMDGKVFQAFTITIGFCVEIDQNSTENISDLAPGDLENSYPVLKGTLLDARMYGGDVTGMQPQSSPIKPTVSVHDLSATVSRVHEPPPSSHEPTLTVDQSRGTKPLSPDPGTVSRDPATTPTIEIAASEAVKPDYYAKCPYCNWSARCDLPKLHWAVRRHVLGRLNDKAFADPRLRAYVIRKVLQGQLKMTPEIEMRIQHLEGGQEPLEIAKWPRSANSARDPCANYLVLETVSAMQYPAEFALQPKIVVNGVESILERNVKKKKAVINF